MKDHIRDLKNLDEVRAKIDRYFSAATFKLKDVILKTRGLPRVCMTKEDWAKIIPYPFMTMDQI